MKKDLRKEPSVVLEGLGVAPGIAIGPAFVVDQRAVFVPERVLASEEIEDEIARFRAGIARTQKQLTQIRQKASAMPAGMAGDIGLLLDAYHGMVSSSRLVRGVERRIAEESKNAEFAVQEEIGALAANFSAMNDDYLASRADDVRQVGMRLIRNLLQQHYNPFAAAPAGSLLIAEEITPADTALMDPSCLAGFAAVLGGAEGHAAIMARALGIPAVLGVAALIGSISSGDEIVIDGTKGKIILRPDAQTLQAYKKECAKAFRETRKLETLREKPAITLDGTFVRLEANLELVRDAQSALDAGAEGIGLLRTEFAFMNRSQLPSQDEQFETLRELVEKMDGKPTTIRTLDVGGEKLISALDETLVGGPNPALGLRAIRLGLKEPKILDAQLSAILRAAAYGPVRILVPMVSSVGQMRLVRARLMQIYKKLHKKGVRVPAALPLLGAMIEIPGAALTADALAKACDFFAIGSNDLTQYTLAVDRGDDHVADLYNPYHPSVLRLIQFVIAAAWRANIPVSGCGELAGSPQATALLLGLGLRQFSMAPARISLVKQEVRRHAMSECVAFAENVMAQTEEDAITELLAKGPGGKNC